MKSSSIALFLLICRIAFPLPAGHQSSPGELEDQIRREYCGIIEDPHNTIWQERLQAVETMGEPGRQALLSMLTSNESDRPCALEFLYSFRENRSIPILRSIITNSEDDPNLRARAIDLLTEFQDVESLDSIIALAHSKEAALFLSSINALSRFDDDRARSTLRDLAAGENLPPRWVGDVLYRIGEQRDVEAIPLLIELGQRGDDTRRFEVSIALTKIDTFDSCIAAKETWDSILDPAWKVSTAEAMIEYLERQRAQTQDEAQRSDIDRLIAEIRQ